MAEGSHVDEEARRRAGRREANLRLLNERIADANLRIAGDEEPPTMLRIACECANDECDESLDVHAQAFARLRDSSIRFAVVEGHVLTDVEHVIERFDRGVVVEKVGTAARAAADRLS